MVFLSTVLLLSCFATFLAVWWVCDRRPFVVTPFLMFGVTEMVSGWPATIYGQATGLVDAYPALLMSLAFLAFLMGFALTLGKRRFHHGLIARFRDAPVRQDAAGKVYLPTIIIVALGLISLGLYLYQGMPPLLEAVGSFVQNHDYLTAVGTLTKKKEAITKGYYFGGSYRGQGVITQVLRIGWTYLAIMALLLYHKTKSRRWMVVFALVAFGAIAFIGGVGQRVQIMMLFVCVFIALSLFARLQARHILVLAVLGLVVILLTGPLSAQMSGLRFSENVLKDTFVGVVKRVSLGNGMNNIVLYRFIEDGFLDFGYGTFHWEKLLTAFPGITVGTPLSRQIFLLKKPFSTLTTFASTTNFGLLYADFGPGVILCYFFIGALTALAHVVLFRMKKGVLELPAIAFLISSFFYLSVGSSIGVAAMWFVLILFYLVMRLGVEVHRVIFSMIHFSARPTKSPLSAV